MAENFVTVFNVATASDALIWFALPGLVGICIGAILVFKPKFWMKISTNLASEPRHRLLNWFIFGFAMLWTVFVSANSYQQHQSAMAMLHDGKFEIVERILINFIAENYSNKQESFDVGGKHFWYSSSLITEGYRITAAQGGVIKNGLHVRISYQNNMILRLEIAT